MRRIDKMKNKRWALLGCLILLTCMILVSIPVMASSSTVTVSGTIPLAISNVHVANITSNSATISWDTNGASNSQVFYDTTIKSYTVVTNYAQHSGLDSAVVAHHSVTLSNLFSSTTYHFMVQSLITGTRFTAVSADTTFKTLASVPCHVTVVLISIPNPSDSGQTVYFGVGIIASICNGIPTGTVTFIDNTTNKVLGTSPVLFGVAGFSTSSLTVGSHKIIAVYSGDSNFAAGTSNVVVQKVHYDTTTNLTASPNPSTVGQSVAFKATVSPNKATGSITFYDGSTSLGNVSLSSGSASINTNKLTVGYHNITAVYTGDSSYAGSTSNVVVQKVKGKTVCSWPSKPSPCSFGQPCTFKIQIGVQSGTGNPTGTVTFYDGSKTLGTGSMSGDGTAQFSISSLARGTHSITAFYGGNDNFDGCSSNTFSQVIK